MEKYEIIRDTKQFDKSELNQIKGLCAFMSEEPETVAAFATAEEAQKALQSYQSSIYEVGGAVTSYGVEQYHIEINEYDEEGEFVGGGDVLDYTPLKITLTVDYEEVATYDSYAAAKAAFDALEDAEDENEDTLKEVWASIAPFARKIMLVKR